MHETHADQLSLARWSQCYTVGTEKKKQKKKKKHENKEQGKTQPDTPHTKNHEATHNKNNIRTTALERLVA